MERDDPGGSHPQIDLSSREKRIELSPPTLKAFFSIMDKWQVQDEDAKLLLGGITNGSYYELKKNAGNSVLNTDTLTRISYLIGIFTALNVLHTQTLADKWVQLPNTNPIFGGATPLQYMIKDGTPAFRIVRQILDARRAGS